MRFKCKDYGDKRVVKRFALFPMFIPVEDNSTLNTRLITRKEGVWLETVYLAQHVVCGQYGKEWETHRLATRDEYVQYKNKKREEKKK